jgi:hypothetical protein
MRLIAKVGCSYIPYTTIDREMDEKKIAYSYRSAHDLFKCYGKTIFNQPNYNETETLEVKGAFTFLLVIVVRYKNEAHDPMFLELQIGQIDSAFDSMELLRPLLHDMEPGLQKLKPSKEGKSTVTVMFGFW